MPRRRLLMASIAVAAVVGVLAGWWLASGDSATDHLTSSGAGSLPESGIPVATDVTGDPLPDVAAESLDGQPVALRSLAGQPLVLNFWYSTCLPCRKEMPAFQQVHVSKGDRVRIVGVNPLDGVDRARQFSDEVGATYETVRDPDGRVTAALGVARFPTTVFVAPSGTVLETKTGALSAAELEATIADLYPS